MREMSVAEQRYQALLAVLSDGETVTDVTARFGVRRQTVHESLVRYEGGGLVALVDRSHRPRSCPHQMASVAEAAVLALRWPHPSWGPRRLHFELAKRELEPVPSESAIYRCLIGGARLDPGHSHRAALRGTVGRLGGDQGPFIHRPPSHTLSLSGRLVGVRN